MKTSQLLNYARDSWIAGSGDLAELPSAIDGSPVALTGSGGLDFESMLRHARQVGGPALRRMTFHERTHQQGEPAMWLIAETNNALTQLTSLGAAGIMGAMWLWERRTSQKRESQIDEAHAINIRDCLVVVERPDVPARNQRLGQATAPLGGLTHRRRQPTDPPFEPSEFQRQPQIRASCIRVKASLGGHLSRCIAAASSRTGAMPGRRSR